MSELGERVATVEADNNNMKDAIKSLSDRVAKLEKTIWYACGGLGALQVLLSYLKH